MARIGGMGGMGKTLNNWGIDRMPDCGDMVVPRRRFDVGWLS